MDKSRIYTIVFSMLVIGFTIAAGFAIVAMESSSSSDLKKTVARADDAITHTRSWNDRAIGRQYDEIFSSENEDIDTALQNKVQQLQKLTEEMMAYIILLQADLAEYVDGPDCPAVKDKRSNVENHIYYPVRVGDLNYTESYGQSIFFMIKDVDNAGKSRATHLKGTIQKYKADILSIDNCIQEMSLGLECNDVAGETWEEVNFGSATAANALICMNTLISDIRAAEAEALFELTHHYNQQNEE